MAIVSDYTALLSGSSWTGGPARQATTVSFSFSDAPASSWSAVGYGSFRPLSDAQKDIVRAALAQWQAVSGIAFVEAKRTEGMITFGLYRLSYGTAGEAMYPSPGASLSNGLPHVSAYASMPNVFLHGGSGNDALQVSMGQNVLDGGLGSNFMTGGLGAGTDTFFTDARAPGVVWNTIRNFHAGDAATLWGYVPGVSSYRWETASAGAAGSEGATLRANIVGGAGRSGDGIDASITFAGVSVADAQRFQVATGVQPAGAYLYITNAG